MIPLIMSLFTPQFFSTIAAAALAFLSAFGFTQPARLKRKREALEAKSIQVKTESQILENLEKKLMLHQEILVEGLQAQLSAAQQREEKLSAELKKMKKKIVQVESDLEELLTWGASLGEELASTLPQINSKKG